MRPLLIVTAWIALAACRHEVHRVNQRSEGGAAQGTCLALVNGVVTTGHPSVVPVITTNGGLCTGTFVSGTTLLTAAHCLDRTPHGGLRVGGIAPSQVFHYGKVGAGERKVWEDLAVVLFPQAVARSAASLNDQPPKPGDQLLLVGYGQTDLLGNNQPDGKKRYGHNDITEITENGTVISYWSSTDPRDAEPGEKAMTGRGDSGGPVFLKGGGLIGIVSQGRLGSSRLEEFDLNLFSQPSLDLMEKAVEGGARINGLANVRRALGQTPHEQDEEQGDPKLASNSGQVAGQTPQAADACEGL